MRCRTSRVTRYLLLPFLAALAVSNPARANPREPLHNQTIGAQGTYASAQNSQPPSPSTGTSAANQAADRPATRSAQEPFFVVTSNVIGRSVRSNAPSGEFIGHLGNLIIDGESGQVLYAIINRGSFFDFGPEAQVIVPFQFLDFPGEYGFPILKVSSDKLDKAPSVKGRDLETLLHDPSWLQSVSDYYGVGTPAGKSKAPIPVAATALQAKGQHWSGESSHELGDLPFLQQGRRNLADPNIYGVVRWPIASVAGLNYLPALKKHHGD